MDVKHHMQTELQNQRFPSALADLMKTGDCTVVVVQGPKGEVYHLFNE